ncbi:unnamed protein product [Closterium sp. NIES-65]|nr:unnamed protein product [Closterium sp. NIES-65]
MAKTKYYAVRKGHQPGIYLTWPECQRQVYNFKGNQCKSFESLDEARSYLALANIFALYRMEFDGASKGNPGRAGAGSVLRDEHGKELVCMREGVGHGTCNMAEYRAFIGGVELALALGITRLHVQGDSMLVVMQVQGKWKHRLFTPSVLPSPLSLYPSTEGPTPTIFSTLILHLPPPLSIPPLLNPTPSFFH